MREHPSLPTAAFVAIPAASLLALGSFAACGADDPAAEPATGVEAASTATETDETDTATDTTSTATDTSSTGTYPPDPDPGDADAGTDPDEPDAGGPSACPCFDGGGTYCADAAAARAVQEGCTLPKATKHGGDLLSCHGGAWRWDTTCDGACNGAGTGDDACETPVYQLPWKCGQDRMCTAVNAESWHHMDGSFSEFAFDFKFSPNGKVRAARGGVVHKLHFVTQQGDPCYDGCDGSSDYCKATCGDKANAVTIKHSDGTVAQYLHLNAKAQGLSIGDRVEQGQLVALSGNTGWSTGPHLHFMVMEKGCQSWSCQSIPIEFFAIGKPKKWHTYTSHDCP